jgi:YD repeat-containing protein
MTFAYDTYGGIIQERHEFPQDNQTKILKIMRSFLNNGMAHRYGLVTREEFLDGATDQFLSGTVYGYDETIKCGGVQYISKPSRFSLTTLKPVVATGTFNPTVMAYDDRGNMVCRETPEGVANRFEYDTSGSLPQAIINGLGQAIHLDYYGVGIPASNRGPAAALAQVADVNGQIGKIEYDAFGRKTLETLAEGIGWSSWRYADDPSRGVNSIEQLDASGAHSTKEFDGLGRLLTTASDTASGRSLITSVSYDQTGNQVTAVGPYLTGSVSPKPRRTEYDEFGRIVSLSDADGNKTEYCYDRRRRVTELPTGESALETRNQAGSVALYGVFSPSSMNCEARLSGSPELTVEYNYDTLNRLLEIRRGDRLYSQFAYSTIGLRTSIVDANLGTTEYQYDQDGRVTEISSPENRASRFEYDRLGRVTTQTFINLSSGETTASQLTYDGPGLNTKGRLSRIVSPGFSRDFEYDALGNVAVSHTNIGGVTKTLQRRYDMYGRLVSLRSEPYALDYSYEKGMLTKVSDGNGALIQLAGTNMLGLPTEFSIRGIGKLVRHYSEPGDSDCPFNEPRLCEVVAHDVNNQQIFEEKYSRDAQGRIERFDDGLNHTLLRRDAAGRLVAVLKGDLGSAVSPALIPIGATQADVESMFANATPAPELFTFDPNGRMSWSSNSGNYIYASDPQHIPADGPVQLGANASNFGADGRLQELGDLRVWWNVAGQVSTIMRGDIKAQIFYDGNGRTSEVRSGSHSLRFFEGGLACDNADCNLDIPGLPVLVRLLANGQTDAAITDARTALRGGAFFCKPRGRNAAVARLQSIRGS